MSEARRVQISVYDNSNPNQRRNIVNKQIETINITPAPMPIHQAVELYQMMTEAGKVGFVECFHTDDQYQLRKALDDAGEILYESGGFHTIIGKCVGIAGLTDAEGYGAYKIESEKRRYIITLNLPIGEQYVPPNAYPKDGDLVVVKAEGISEVDDGMGDGSVYYTGYAEICYVATDETHAKALAETDGVYVVE